ncbi:alpha/beta fold hydrolase [Azohydromonas sp. G-1-1-14]|uniref:Proline iminopeptidase n=1 Tax=Azohydromonas caseinilytica TaxID=2728836 RepID=A0A848FKX7_9BURK|nr:alpha/beta fold hydrolase [Azohydromonas caseinilytica]
MHTHALPVGGGHVLHVEEWGRADGLPALLLHGGPGSGCSPLLRRGFDLERYRLICPDQRGAGQSTPRGEIANNTTAKLLDDLWLLRRRLGIERWLVVGGSWGATLALAHALDQPEAVSALLLRNTFLARESDIQGFFSGAPQALARGWPTLPELDEEPARALALRWWGWERHRSGQPEDAPAPSGEALAALVDRYRVQAHYLRQGCGLQSPPLLERCAALPQVPVRLLHGAQDAVCPPLGAQALQAVVPWAELELLPGVGHDPAHPLLQDALQRALDAYAARGDFGELE